VSSSNVARSRWWFNRSKLYWSGVRISLVQRGGAKKCSCFSVLHFVPREGKSKGHSSDRAFVQDGLFQGIREECIWEDCGVLSAELRGKVKAITKNTLISGPMLVTMWKVP